MKSRPQSRRVRVFNTADEASRIAAVEVAALVKQRSDENRGLVLGLATGVSQVPLYRELVRLHREDGLSFVDVTTLNLDEYWPIEPAAPQSFRAFMHEHLFDRVDLDPARCHVPSGTVDEAGAAAHAAEYEAKIEACGGIDLQYLGIGRNGHIGFNEPGSARDSRTRLVDLAKTTRLDAQPAFGNANDVPRHAITMGLATILSAKRVRLLAFGEAKARAVFRCFGGPVDALLPASLLQEHSDAAVYLDIAAASSLPA